LRDRFPRESLAGRPSDLWRYRELLPYADAANIVSLGESAPPILPAARLGAELGLANLQIKDESRLPTGSFKARGMAMAITMANEFGIKRVACPTAGNAGGAMAAYASRAGMESFVFMPDDTPLINMKETHLAGARVFRVNGLINDCGRLVGEGREPMGWFDLSTLKEPYRIEGKKTMGLELAEQLGWELPDVILYPTGGGTGLIGMWKAFAELEAIGWLPSGKRPRMIACQSEGCAPIVRAFEAGEKHAPPFENAHTVASGLRVPVAVGDFMILAAVRESAGCAGELHRRLDGALGQARGVGHLPRDRHLHGCPRSTAGQRHHPAKRKRACLQHRLRDEVPRLDGGTDPPIRHWPSARLASHRRGLNACEREVKAVF
jgi:threonine synthase